MAISITLPDGSKKVFEKPVSGLEVAKAIGPRLAQAALGIKVDGELRDLATVIDRDASVAIVTEKKRDRSVDPDALFLIRHSAAHVMAEAIQDVIGQGRAAGVRPADRHRLLLRHVRARTADDRRATSRGSMSGSRRSSRRIGRSHGTRCRGQTGLSKSQAPRGTSTRSTTRSVRWACRAACTTTASRFAAGTG